MQARSRLKLVTPTGEKRAVMPQRQPNSQYRKREYLTPTEIGKLVEAAKGNRYGQRDATMILTAYRHALRASEVCDLEWSQVDFERAELHVRRAKNGKATTHPIRGDELRELRKLRRESTGSFVFMTERGGPFTTDSFNWLVKPTGKKAKLPFQVPRPPIATQRRLQVGWRWSRHPLDPRLYRPQRHQTHGQIYRTRPYTVPRFLEIESLGGAPDA